MQVTTETLRSLNKANSPIGNPSPCFVSLESDESFGGFAVPCSWSLSWSQVAVAQAWRDGEGGYMGMGKGEYVAMGKRRHMEMGKGGYTEVGKGGGRVVGEAGRAAWRQHAQRQ